MTAMLNPYACWPTPNLLERNDCGMAIRHEMTGADKSTPSSSAASSTSTSPRSPEQADLCHSGEVGVAYSLQNDILNYQNAVSSAAHLYALNHNFLQQQLMLRQFAQPSHGPHQLPFIADYSGMAAASANVKPATAAAPVQVSTNSPTSSTDLYDALEPTRRTKRKRSDRALNSSDFRTDGEESDSESSGERYRAMKQAKLGAEAVADGDLSDITSLLSLPQKEAAQRLGISESMLCKRFKECTRRKWPFRFLRKIEKMISSLETQKDVEPLSAEDQDRLEDLLRQKVECLAPVKIRITKSPSPVPCSRATLNDSDLTLAAHDDDSDSDDSDTRELDYESEAIENLIHLSRSTSPRSAFYSPQIAC